LNNLYILIVSHLQEYTVDFLSLFSILAVICAILVIVNKNPVVSVLFLICLFILISGYLILLGMNFIGISYLLVYIGAVSILFLFILMLINIRISEIQTETNNSLPLAIVISVSFYISIYEIIPFNIFEKSPLQPEFQSSWTEVIKSIGSSYEEVNFLVSNQWDSNLIEVLHITGIGNILYTNYFLWLILASIILLLAMVGTIIITIKQ
jgi:NADH-ubiquinone oxidoreductase chain 6